LFFIVQIIIEYKNAMKNLPIGLLLFTIILLIYSYFFEIWVGFILGFFLSIASLTLAAIEVRKPDCKTIQNIAVIIGGTLMIVFYILVIILFIHIVNNPWDRGHRR
jgi:hypothetical protein